MKQYKFSIILVTLCLFSLSMRHVNAGGERDDLATIHWTGTTDQLWHKPGNWTATSVEGINAVTVNDINGALAPDRVFTDTTSFTYYNDKILFDVIFDDRGSAQTTVNLTSDSTGTLGQYTHDLGAGTVQIESLQFQQREGEAAPPTYTLNVSGVDLEVSFEFRNNPQAIVVEDFSPPIVQQNLNISEGRTFTAVDLRGATVVNNGTMVINGDIDYSNITNNGIVTTQYFEEFSTITNNATSALNRGKLNVRNEYAENARIINNGGSTWFYDSAYFDATSIRNKISSSGVPGYWATTDNITVTGDEPIGIDVNGTTNGFIVLNGGNPRLTFNETVLTLYLDTSASYQNDRRTLIYKNGTTGGHTFGQANVVIKDTAGNELPDATAVMDYTVAEAVATPEGVEVPDDDNEEFNPIGATLIPILRATINYMGGGTITEEVKGHIRGITGGASKSLERVRTAVHKIFSAVSGSVRNKTWQPSSWTGGSIGSSGIQKGISPMSFRAPSLDNSYLSNTGDMMGVATQETLQRFAPLRTSTTGIWAQPFGQIVEQGFRAGVSGFTSKTAGILFGLDHKVNQNLVVGGGIGSANSTSELKSNSSKAKILDYFTSLFATWTENNWYVEGFVTGAYNQHRSGRVIDANTVATNRHNGYQIVPSIGAGYRISLFDDRWILVPSLSTTYIHSHENKYTEEGAGNNNQKINSRWSSQLRTEGGFSLSTHVAYDEFSALYTVGLKAIMQDPLRKGHISGTVGGNGFGISNNDQTELYGGLNLSAEFKLREGWFVDAHYAGEFGAGLKNHEAALRIGRRF